MNLSLRSVSLALTLGLLTACSGGTDNTDGALLDLGNLPTQSTSIRLKLACPASISPGTELTGLSASFTDQNLQPISGAFVMLTAATGTISAPSGFPNSGGASSDEFGLVSFDYAIPATTPLNSIVIIRGEVNYLGARVMQSCSLAVKNSNFLITQPLNASSLLVGTANAIPVQMQWTDENNNGVAGNVRLTAGVGSSLVTAAGVVRAVTVVTSTAGDLDGSTAFACTAPGAATLRAEELGNAARSSTVTVNCITAPLYLDVQVSNDQISAAPANGRFADFVIKPVARDNKPVVGLPITVELLTPLGGGDRLLVTAAVTNDGGTATSRYEAGTVGGTAEFRFCVRGSGVCTNRLVRVNAAAAAAGNVSFTLSCPPALNVGATSAIGTARLSNAAGAGIANANITLSPARGAVNAPPDQSSSFGGNTGNDGRLLFTYTAPTDIKADTGIGIVGRSNVGGENLSTSCSLLVRADLFQLTAPEDNSTQSLGTAAARAVSMAWLNGDRAGVVGPIVVSTTNNARLTTDLNQTGAQQLTLSTDASGNFNRSLFFICTASGPVEIRAVDQASFSKLSTLTVQCVDPASSMTARVTPAIVDRDPSNNRFAEATFTLFGQGGSNIKNADLLFTLIRSAGGGDRLLNTTGVTDEGGSALVRYEAGNTTGTTVIEGCLRNSTICERVNITVQ